MQMKQTHFQNQTVQVLRNDEPLKLKFEPTFCQETSEQKKSNLKRYPQEEETICENVSNDFFNDFFLNRVCLVLFLDFFYAGPRSIALSRRLSAVLVFKRLETMIMIKGKE